MVVVVATKVVVVLVVGGKDVVGGVSAVSVVSEVVAVPVHAETDVSRTTSRVRCRIGASTVTVSSDLGSRKAEPAKRGRSLWDVSTGSAVVNLPTAEAVPREFEEFYRTKRDHLARALSITLRNDELGNEAADEAMTRSFQRWRTVSEYGNPVGWAYRVGLNWALSRKRRAKRELVVDLPERAVEDSDFNPEIEAALAEIPVDQRAVLVLRFYFDWDIGRVAEALRIPNGTVKSRQRRGLDAVARRLEVRR